LLSPDNRTLPRSGRREHSRQAPAVRGTAVDSAQLDPSCDSRGLLVECSQGNRNTWVNAHRAAQQITGADFRSRPAGRWLQPHSSDVRRLKHEEATMRRRFCTILLLLATASVSIANADDSAEAVIRKLEATLTDAGIRNDVATQERLLADEFVVI